MMTGKKEKITILGVGNILLADEGFGVHFVRWLSGRYKPSENVHIIDGGTLGYALMDIICSCDNLIVIDVLKAKDTPGSIYRFNIQEMQAHMPPPTTAHEVTFFDVLFKAELMDELPETLFLCIVPTGLWRHESGNDTCNAGKVSGYGEITSGRIIQVEYDFGKSRSCMNCIWRNQF